MDLPTSRELELETLLRQRDAQVAELSVSYAVVWNQVIQPYIASGRGDTPATVLVNST